MLYSQLEDHEENMLDGMLSAEIAFNRQTRYSNVDFKKVMRRQGTTCQVIEEFSCRLDRFKTMRKLGGSITGAQGEIFDKLTGHAHSDYDSERDGDPWDEYNKIDRFTSLDSKIGKKLNSFPHIDMHSRIPYVHDRNAASKKENKDP